MSLHFFSAVLIPFFLEYGKITFTQIMLIQSWFTFWAFALEIPTGAVADYLGRKTSLISGAVCNGIGALVYISHPHILVFLFAEFMWAMGLALMSGSDDAIVYDSLKKFKKEHRSKKIFANISSYHILAISVGAPIGSLIAGFFGVKWAMGMMIVPFTIAAVIGLTLKEPKAKRKVESKRYLNILVGGAGYLKNHKILRLLALDSALVAALAFFIVWIYQLKLTELGIPIAFFGFVHAGIAGSQILVMQNFAKLERLFKGKKRYLLWSALIAGVFFIIAGFSDNAVVAIISILIIAAFGMSRERLFASYMNKYIESHNRATVISSIRMLKTLFRALIYPIIGILVEFSLMYAFVGLGLVLMIIAIFSKVKEEHLLD
ncbi:MFS transporter [Candidatus Woesearchaeota archaeon]|nr:MFS transporter [Candidatus Woesearchaeota archaeon]